MRPRTSLCLLATCAFLAACTVAAPNGPDATVTKPAIGRPPAPASEGAALASEAFTAYADVGASSNGLAPGDTYQNLHTSCMDDAGYGQYASVTPFPVRANRGIGFPQEFGPWGYIGLSQAEQYGFNTPDTGGPDENEDASGPTGTVPGLPAASGKCFNIVQDFNNAQFVTSTAIIETLNNDIGNDVINDPDLARAQQAWSACMARNGYGDVQPNTIWQQYTRDFQTAAPPAGSASNGQVAPPALTPAQNQAQIAAAVTDAQCTLSTDLGGIYFAIQTSYEQQFVTANQQALSAAIREFKANYATELSKLPALLRTTSATLNLPGPGQPGSPSHPGKHKPSRTRS